MMRKIVDSFVDGMTEWVRENPRMAAVNLLEIQSYVVILVFILLFK